MKQDISTIPFENLGFKISKEYNEAEVTEFIKDQRFATRSEWILPQLLAEINTWKLHQREDGTFCGLETIKLNTETPDIRHNCRVLGILAVCKYPSRGELLLGSQHSISGRDYSKLVPLVLSAFKKFRNIKYSSWVNIEALVEEALAKAMTCEYEDFTRAELLQLRIDGMKYKDPLKKPRNPMTTYGLYNVSGKISTLPILAKIMLTQIWCAHPSNRTQYMVLDPKDWDNIPEPLVSVDVLKDTTKPLNNEIPPWLR